MTDEESRDPFFVPDKDPEYVYIWANRADRNMVQIIADGFEVVSGAPELPPGVRQKIAGLTGQANETPVTEEVRTRGDVILVRMRKDVYDRKFTEPEKARRLRQATSLDTLVEQANDQARAALARARQRSIRQRHVFQTTDDSKFEDQGVG